MESVNKMNRFTVTYTDKKTGELITEEPRLMVRVVVSPTSVKQYKALIIGDDTVFAAVPIERSDAELWARAREKHVFFPVIRRNFLVAQA
jgi:hypothetical protein